MYRNILVKKVVGIVKQMCYNGREVNAMDEEILTTEEITEEEEKPVYTPRPKWQVWAARLGLVIMIIAVILYYMHIATGGLL